MRIQGFLSGMSVRNEQKLDDRRLSMMDRPDDTMELAPMKKRNIADELPSVAQNERICPEDSLLPEGIERINDEAIAATRLIEEYPPLKSDDKKIIAAFDFDGTCISGSSPKKLVSILSKRKKLSPYKLLRIGLWGLAYKLNLPKDAEGVRSRVFSAFAGLSAVNVNDFLCKFYYDKIAPIYREEADAAMIAHIEAGHIVVLVSASFEPIIAAAMTEHPIQFALASRMHIDGSGCYTDQVEGKPTEGADKLEVLRDFADEYFGEGNWELGFSYADHFSDLEMLDAAKHPCAVTPDHMLKRVAEEMNWEILDWQ